MEKLNINPNMTKEDSSEIIEKKKKEKSLKEMTDDDNENYRKYKQIRAEAEYEKYRKRLEYERLEHDLNSF